MDQFNFIGIPVKPKKRTPQLSFESCDLLGAKLRSRDEKKNEFCITSFGGDAVTATNTKLIKLDKDRQTTHQTTKT